MVKGGFQGLDISGVDLTAQSPTLPGAYATCAGADGKPIRVQTAYGQVECSVKKVSTNYVLAGVTGDGKILSITIGSTDGITVTESVPNEAGEVYVDNPVDFSTTTSSTPYITGYDGIVRLRKSVPETFQSNAAVHFKTGLNPSNSVLLLMPVDAPVNTVLCCFVKKGTKIYASNIVEGVSATFAPYKPV